MVGHTIVIHMRYIYLKNKCLYRFDSIIFLYNKYLGTSNKQLFTDTLLAIE